VDLQQMLLQVTAKWTANASKSLYSVCCCSLELLYVAWLSTASTPACCSTLLLPLLQGINVTSLREIKLLREIKSPYVVELLDVFPHKRKVNMVRSTAQLSAAAAAIFYNSS
jgi:hypothetical protein